MSTAHSSIKDATIRPHDVILFHNRKIFVPGIFSNPLCLFRMQYLWSPWRMPYILEHKHEPGCVFCHAQDHPDDPQHLVVYMGKLAYVILNRYPYTSGHVMVIPKQHTASIEELSNEVRSEMMELTNTCLQVLRKVYSPEGFNLGMNIGEAAGAGIAEHVHMHIVPRWSGDTNFMSSLGQTRVLPEALGETYRRVRSAWPQPDDQS